MDTLTRLIKLDVIDCNMTTSNLYYIFWPFFYIGHRQLLI